MPTDVRETPRHMSRGARDDVIIAKGQAEIIALIDGRISRVIAWFRSGLGL